MSSISSLHLPCLLKFGTFFIRTANPTFIWSILCCHKLVLCLLCKYLPVSINIDYYERLTRMVHSIFLEHGNHGNHTISDVICHLFLQQTKHFFYIRVLQSVGATLYYMLHAHLFLLPQIVPRMIHAVSFASVCISQKIECDSSTPRA
jgi:hypothetical protein